MIDYLVVGSGLAGISFCERLEQHGHSYRVVSDNSQQASKVAGGLYNPIILKRLTMAWKAAEQLAMALPFYADLEKKLSVALDHKVAVFRKFASIEEQNNWFAAMDKPGFDAFLSPGLQSNTNPHIEAPFGFGEVMQTGRVDTKVLLDAYRKYLANRQVLMEEAFDHTILTLGKDHVSYKGQTYRQLVFAEGFGMRNNPFFGYLPLNGTKGELLTVKIPGLGLEQVLKSGVFMIPLGGDHYRIGATYKWKDKTNIPTEAAKTELLDKLRTLLKVDVELVEHVAGIRPTVADRRPLVGRHPEHPQLYLLNGFGSLGVLIAPYASQGLYQLIQNGTALDEDMDLSRFTKKYYAAGSAN